MNQITHEITFKSDSFNLVGILHLPESRNPPVVIGCHGLLSDSHSPKQLALAKKCCDTGLAYFRFDHRGCGKSEGSFWEVTSFHARCRDLKFALNKLQSLGVVNERVGLFGSSLGGSVCLEFAGSRQIQAMVTFAAPLKSRFTRTAALPMNLSFDLSGRLSKIRNIHIFHGNADDTVPLAHARSIYRQVAKPKNFTIQKNGDHRMSNPSHQKAFLEAAVQWFQDRLLDC